MEILEHLTKKVQDASRELLTLKNERKQLLSELELLRQQSSQFQPLIRDNERLKKDQDRLRTRLLKMQKKVERLLALELPITSPFGGTKHDENHAQ